MKQLLLFATLLFVACTQPSYPSIDNPSVNLTDEDTYIIEYIDRRMSQEYYWLEEVQERSTSFNRRQTWSAYLPSMLSMLSTNVDDGYINSRGQRLYYSYIRELDKDTRAKSTTMGFGLGIYYVIISFESGDLGFVVDYVYADSPAEQAGVRRGDIITHVNGQIITHDNYMSLFNAISQNTSSSLSLEIRRQVYDSEQDANIVVAMDAAAYYTNPVLHSEVLTLDDVDVRIGYLVYNAFEMDYNDELLLALGNLSAEGVDRMILDLRTNGGGAVESATKLGSALLGSEYVGGLLCELRRNPQNMVNAESSYRYIEDVGVALNLDQLTVICSEYTASASELLIEGLRGLDIPVTLIGSKTQGKNCGMDVTHRIVGNKYLEFAPITFMCFNAKGFGDYGEGLDVDVNLCGDNQYGVKDEIYPLPRCTWGDMKHDIALVTAVANITGKSVTGGSNTRCSTLPELTEYASVARPLVGTHLYEE